MVSLHRRSCTRHTRTPPSSQKHGQPPPILAQSIYLGQSANITWLAWQQGPPSLPPVDACSPPSVHSASPKRIRFPPSLHPLPRLAPRPAMFEVLDTLLSEGNCLVAVMALGHDKIPDTQRLQSLQIARSGHHATPMSRLEVQTVTIQMACSTTHSDTQRRELGALEPPDLARRGGITASQTPCGSSE